MSKNQLKKKSSQPVEKQKIEHTEMENSISDQRMDTNTDVSMQTIELNQDKKVIQGVRKTSLPNTTKMMLSKLKKNKEQKVSSKLGINEVAKWKLFFVSDMDEEAQYLHTMSVQGLHFKAKHGIQYVFEKGDSKNYYYHLGYYEEDKRDGARYIENYVEAGWEDVYQEIGEFDGVWNYFRTEAADGAPAPSIFSDKLSRMALYNRLMSSWRSLLIMVLACLLFMVFLFGFLIAHPTGLQSLFISLWTLVFIFLIVTMLTYLRTYKKISNKLAELKY